MGIHRLRLEVSCRNLNMLQHANINIDYELSKDK